MQVPSGYTVPAGSTIELPQQPSAAASGRAWGYLVSQ